MKCVAGTAGEENVAGAEGDAAVKGWKKPAPGIEEEIWLQGLVRARLAVGTSGAENVVGAEEEVAARGWRRHEVVHPGQGSGELL